jgi:hypothetical protein
MFSFFDWWGYVTIAALPVLGFAIGLAWARRHPQPTPPAHPEAQPGPDSRLLDVVESVQRQVEELAERQDFAERLLASRSEPRQDPKAAEKRIPTPV